VSNSFHLRTPSNFLGRKLLAGTVVELGGAGRFMIGKRLGVFERAAVLKIGGDTGRAEGVTAG